MEIVSSGPAGAGRRRPRAMPWAVGLWLVLAGIGMGFLWDYENAPGMAAAAPARWPAASALEPPSDLPRLVLLAHPQCPCTRASLAELARVMAENQGRLTADVLFYAPRSADATWYAGDLLARAGEIPGVRVWRDDGGIEAARFGAATSGQTLLYGSAGDLLFAGGITPGRGHEGDNAGRDGIFAALRDGAPARQSSVFGCSLREPQGAS